MLLLPVRQYYSQTDSATSHGDRMCFSSTCAMAVKFIHPDALSGSNADDNYLRTVLKYGDTTEYPSQVKACKDYGVLATFYKTGNKALLLNELKSGYPVATGILHKGPHWKPRGGGHWMLCIGDEGSNGIFHDPYGKMDNTNGGYITIGSGGKEVRYDWNLWLNRWEIEGRGSGWFMTFRSTKQTQPITTPINTHSNTWEGVLTTAAKAGAKFPEVVAAQWALESGWGQHTSGKNNYFGIKSSKAGDGTLVRTSEFKAGMEIKVDAWFKNFTSLEECVADLVNKWYKDYKSYKGVNRANTYQECCNLLVSEGYATDPQYSTKLIDLLQKRG